MGREDKQESEMRLAGSSCFRECRRKDLILVYIESRRRSFAQEEIQGTVMKSSGEHSLVLSWNWRTMNISLYDNSLCYESFVYLPLYDIAVYIYHFPLPCCG